MGNLTRVHGRQLVLSLLALLLWISTPPLATAGPAVVTHDMAWDFTAQTDCLGENVHISGTGHSVFRFEVNAAGRLHLLTVDTFRDIDAIGVDTGTVYNPTGQPAHFVVNLDTTTGSDSFVLVLTNSQRFISQGAGDNFILKEVVVFVMTANGDVSVDSERVSVECRG